MKKFLALIFLAALLAACSKGTSTDLTTGLSYTYNGFGMDKVKVLDSNGKDIKSKKHPVGSTLKIEMHGIKNYTEEDGKIYPGCSVTAIDKETQEVVLQSEDIFANYNGTTKKEFAMPYITLSFGNTFVADKEYILKAHFFDKKNVENVIDIELDFEVTPN